MQQITISPATFKRLEKHIKSFADTPESVINRALDALERPQPAQSLVTEKQIDPAQLPSMKHTKILDTTVAGTAVEQPKWNNLLKMMVRSAVKRGMTCDDLCQLCSINMVIGHKRDEGYSYLPDIDISLQGQSANQACRTVVMIAQSLGIALDIGLVWRNKKDAAHPGQRGRIRTTGSAPAYPSSPPAQPTPLNTERQIDPLQLPDLLHTKILEVEIAGAAVQDPSWNNLLKMMARSAVKHGRTFDEINRMCPHTIVNGRKQDKGYRYLPDIDISVRYHAANKACSAIVALAQSLGIALDIGLEWRNKQDAAYPGERGRLRISGSASA